MLSCALFLASNLLKSDPCDYVNPFIGATTEGGRDSAGLGKTFPGATTPFGMVQLSPDTITGGDNGPGYSYAHHSIEGFSFTHMSGIGWYGDLGNFLVTPTNGELRTNRGKEGERGSGYRSLFRHESETASPGYYGVTLEDYGIGAEMTATQHAGMLRFTFPKNDHSRIQIDLARRVGGTSTEQYVKVVDDNTIQGWMRCTPEGGGWGNGDGKPNYTVYFYAQLSKPLKQFGVWSAEIPADMKRKREDIESDRFQEITRNAKRMRGVREMQGKHLGFYTEFPTKDKEEVLFRSGISFSSLEGAKANLEADIKTWDFDKVKSQTRSLWSKALSQVEVQGGTDDQKRIFYTALYHSLIDPRRVSDVTGEHPSGDGKTKVAKNFEYRTIFSGWDVFRSEFPLMTILHPEVINDEINSWLELAELNQKEYLERWEFLNAYSGCMVGNPAVSVIADAYQKGIRDYDIEKAYRYSRNTVEKFGNGERGYVPGNISETLEHAYSDWCLATLADSLGKKEDAKLYAQRAQNYRNIFDPSVKWFRGKDANGNWLPWPKEGRTGWVWCVESNPFQQGWFVPQDTDGFAKLLGGKQKALDILNEFFDKTPKDMQWNAYYNHANEPVHHVPFLFNRFGAPWLTQKWVDTIRTTAYHNGVEGLCGNDDVGQMSAWYIFASLGFHPICPGDGRYEICGSQFTNARIKLPGNKIFEVITLPKGNPGDALLHMAKGRKPEDIYIQAARLNSKPFNQSWISHADIMKGGRLELIMGPKPNKDWGVN